MRQPSQGEITGGCLILGSQRPSRVIIAIKHMNGGYLYPEHPGCAGEGRFNGGVWSISRVRDVGILSVLGARKGAQKHIHRGVFCVRDKCANQGEGKRERGRGGGGGGGASVPCDHRCAPGAATDPIFVLYPMLLSVDTTGWKRMWCP